MQGGEAVLEDEPARSALVLYLKEARREKREVQRMKTPHAIHISGSTSLSFGALFRGCPTVSAVVLVHIRKGHSLNWVVRI